MISLLLVTQRVETMAVAKMQVFSSWLPLHSAWLIFSHSSFFLLSYLDWVLLRG
ncbi:hypothetical protein [Legionella tunisiensis]|uniref:hypothetical protein n=1 Tax=Legionella tunisiensis TaxID=1034944 RepID=UPI0002F94C17|nr:hypothetical protein [Legionella tunisiensis]